MFNLKFHQVFIIVLLVMAFATIAYAFAWNNTFPVDHSGDFTIGGYSVVNVIYTYSAEDPSIIVFVDFDIYPAARKAGVSLVTGATLTDCGALTAGGHHAHCLVHVSVYSADMLRLVASD